MSFNLKYWGQNPYFKWSPQVSFYITGHWRARRSLKAASFDDYKELAEASGGQAIQVSKSQLPDATDVILDTSTSALVFCIFCNIFLACLGLISFKHKSHTSFILFVFLSHLHQVTVLQRAGNPGKQETFPFMVDESLKNITIYITGTSITYTLTNPGGSRQFPMPCLQWLKIL